MCDENINVGLYPRVSTEDQSKFGHSLDEQEERLKDLCKFKRYNIYKIYREEGVSAKNMDRPKFQEMLEDVRQGKINKIVVFKLDRLTRSIKDLEEICTFLEEYNCSLESMCEDINTATANGKFFVRMLTLLAQLEIEKTSERTKIGMIGAAKKGHFSGKPPIGYIRKDKKFVIDEIQANVIRRIYRMYLDGLSVCSICKTLNKENVFNRKWRTTCIDYILSNKVYIGNMEYGKTLNGEIQIIEDVIPPIIDKTTFECVQKRKEKNLKNYHRKLTYIFMQKIRCPKCNKIIGGSSSTSKNKTKHSYYLCANCKTRINEKKIEKSLIKFLNDMLDFFLIVDNTYKITLNTDTENDIKRYKQLESELIDKIARIKKAFIDGLIEPTTLQKELKEIENDLKTIQDKLKELEDIKTTMNYKQDIETVFNLKVIEKMKLKSTYVKENNSWNILTKEQKQYLINKYIDEIEVDIDKDHNVSILNVLFNKNEIENIGYMFSNDCFDMIVNVNERDIILSNYKNPEEINSYISNLRNYYNVKETIILADCFDINEFSNDNVIQVIPQKKNIKFEKNKYTILQIGA